MGRLPVTHCRWAQIFSCGAFKSFLLVFLQHSACRFFTRHLACQGPKRIHDFTVALGEAHQGKGKCSIAIDDRAQGQMSAVFAKIVTLVQVTET
ncbi:hypothetical protein D3C85_1340610 [compost metagenome]